MTDPIRRAVAASDRNLQGRMRTLVIDTGQDIVGVFSVEDGKYVPYRGHAISSAIQQIEEADEVVTYNGKNHDLAALGKFAGLPAGQDLALKGTHSDMRSICWSDRIWGSSLYNTYSMHFPDRPSFPDSYEGSNECDVYMTFKLWELWKQEKLKVLDGSYGQMLTPPPPQPSSA